MELGIGLRIKRKEYIAYVTYKLIPSYKNKQL